ncbi:hypothetical protein [Algibacter mikhailovii]|uniref:WD40 repeat domain-containing protein n=1 Tax=Algibacter mikhailovii TaxID=425498 RepID=A0A918V9F2_9FLAO|nr:hypothetical protein [Algibacter mikhailovii]GGZ81325.1 hypothetical protein GCM10007028_18510 [Algibacter mikhailovii]
MKFNFFNKKKSLTNMKEEWNRLGSEYAKNVNEMVEFGEKNGLENWKGKEPEDNREHLADEIFNLLKKANEYNTIEQFRNDYPPSHNPIIKLLETKGQSIEQLQFIDGQKIVFLTGTSYQKRQAYVLDNENTLKLDSTINAIGKSKKNNVFAISAENKITTTQGWEGNIISTFELIETKDLGITELIPFNNGLKILLVASEGIYLIAKESEKMIHPVPDLEDEEWDSYIDMENATLSNDNEYIVVGDQCADHRILNQNGEQIGEVGPQSSYNHFCFFSSDDKQLITNSCHFYNGITIGISTENINGLKIEAYEESEDYKVIDDGMRVYVGLTTRDLYILGDAHGYIRAIDKNGKCIWRHFIGSTISGITISDDEKTLWVGSYSGMLHKLQLGKGFRDEHTIGNGSHYEDFRLILWKDEPIMKW